MITKTARQRPAVSIAAGLLLVSMAVAVSSTPAPASQSRLEEQLRDFEENTGLALVEVPDTEGTYLGKTHRGYPVLYTAQMGDVWGRYFARLAMGEIGREVGGVTAFLTGSCDYCSGAAGSVLDRLLARVIGQPMGIMVYLSHGKPGAPRLDIVSGSSTVKPEEQLPEREKIGSGPGKVYTASDEFAAAVVADRELRDRLKKLRGQYIAVDDTLVAFVWSGQERDFSAMIRDNGDFWAMINGIMDSLAGIADHIPPPR